MSTECKNKSQRDERRTAFTPCCRFFELDAVTEAVEVDTEEVGPEEETGAEDALMFLSEEETEEEQRELDEEPAAAREEEEREHDEEVADARDEEESDMGALPFEESSLFSFSCGAFISRTTIASAALSAIRLAATLRSYS